MEAIVSLTSRWQIHIPKAVRKSLGTVKPGMVSIKASKGKLTLTPKKSKIFELGGKFHKHYLKHKDINIDKIRDYIDYAAA